MDIHVFKGSSTFGNDGKDRGISFQNESLLYFNIGDVESLSSFFVEFSVVFDVSIFVGVAL